MQIVQVQNAIANVISRPNLTTMSTTIDTQSVRIAIKTVPYVATAAVQNMT